MKKVTVYFCLGLLVISTLISLGFGVKNLTSGDLLRKTLAGSIDGACLIVGIHPNKISFDEKLLDSLESWANKKNTNLTIYSATTTQLLDFTFGELDKSWARGSIPNLSLEFWSDNPDNSSIETRIRDGELDDYFGQFNLRLKSFLAGGDKILGTDDDRRLYLRPGHEPNGNWYGWSGNPEAYIYAWRRAYNLINNGLNKTQLQWIWSVNNVDVGGIGAESYYPGDQYVDWLGIDGYNWGKSFDWGDWNTPASTFDTMIKRLKILSPSKPISINEVSSTTNSKAVADKNLWITSMFDYAYANNIKMINWFNEDKETDWAIFGGGAGDTTFEGYKAYSAYANAIKDSRVIATNAKLHPKILTQGQFSGTSSCDTTLNLKVNLQGAWQ